MLRPSLYSAARTSTMDERIRIRVADHVSMNESRYGSTTLIFMYRGGCRRLCSLRQPEQQRFSPDKFCLAPWMPLRSPSACSLRRYLTPPDCLPVGHHEFMVYPLPPLPSRGRGLDVRCGSTNINPRLVLVGPDPLGPSIDRGTLTDHRCTPVSCTPPIHRYTPVPVNPGTGLLHLQLRSTGSGYTQDRLAQATRCSEKGPNHRAGRAEQTLGVGLCFIHTPLRHACMNMHQLVPSYTTALYELPADAAQ